MSSRPVESSSKTNAGSASPRDGQFGGRGVVSASAGQSRAEDARCCGLSFRFFSSVGAATLGVLALACPGPRPNSACPVAQLKFYVLVIAGLYLLLQNSILGQFGGDVQNSGDSDIDSDEEVSLSEEEGSD